MSLRRDEGEGGLGIDELFGTRELCRLTGVSVETLRHYLDIGLLSPERVESNSYSRYTARNAMDVLYARMCRGLGLSLPSILEKRRSPLSTQEEMLDRHLAELEEEERRLALQLQRTRQQRELLRGAQERLGRIQEKEASEVPALYRIGLVGPDAPESPERESIIAEWMRYPEYSFVMLTAPVSSLADASAEELPITLSIGMNEHNFEMLGLSFAPPVRRIPNYTSLGTMIETKDPLHLRRDEIARLLEQIREQGRRAAAGLIGRVCTFRDLPSGRLYYLTINIPIA